jgi:hypothetical protein
MSGNLLVRFDEGRVGRASLSPSLLLYQVRGVIRTMRCCCGPRRQIDDHFGQRLRVHFRKLI